MAGATETAPQSPPKRKINTANTLPHLEDDQIIRLAERNVIDDSEIPLKGITFSQLMAGNIEDFPSESEARLKLLTTLAFYCDGLLQIDRIFHKSKLYKRVKDKWNSISESEIREAMNACIGHVEILESFAEIQVNNRDMPDVSNDTMDSLILKNKTQPVIFQRGGKLCRIVRDDNNVPSIEIYNLYSFRGVMGQSASYYKIG